MSPEKQTPTEGLVEEFEQLIRDRFPEGVVRGLEDEFGPHARLAEDAVGNAIEKMARAGDRLNVVLSATARLVWSGGPGRAFPRLRFVASSKLPVTNMAGWR